MKNRRERADEILYGLGLLDLLGEYGEPHIVGSYVMDVMAHNDLDIDVLNDGMSLDKLHRLVKTALDKFAPTWFEAKQETTDEGKTVWFFGFEAAAAGELWNFDIWFFDKETIQKAEDYCARLAERFKNDADAKNAVIRIKKALLERGLYAFDKYTSMDVYGAVLNDGVATVEEFLNRYTK